MNNKMMLLLEFNKILDMLAALAISSRACRRIDMLQPNLSITETERNRNETAEARCLLETIGSPPLVRN